MLVDCFDPFQRVPYAFEPLVPLFPLFNAPHFEFFPSTIFHGKQYRFRYLPNNSESSSGIKLRKRRKKRRSGRSGGKKEKKKREEESIPARTRTKKRDRYLHSRDLKYPEAFRIRYLTLSSSLSALLTPLLSTASLSVGLECTALAYTRLELGFEELYPGPEISFHGPQVPSFVVDLPCNRRKKKRYTENREKIRNILSYYIACRCAVKRVRA